MQQNGPLILPSSMRQRYLNIEEKQWLGLQINEKQCTLRKLSRKHGVSTSSMSKYYKQCGSWYRLKIYLGLLDFGSNDLLRSSAP